ncbi:MAG: hypothetical protein L0H59_07815, partial [Tomitella sp.]|nr:hypothetical protein [Tomitella sp.]
RAAHARRGHAATVTWHSTVAALPASPAGDQMYLPETDGRSSGLPEAIDALDGKLRYAHADGARLLCIVTDSCLPNLETVQRKVTRLHKLGVAVLWVTIPTGGPITVLDHVTHVHADDPDTIGHTIADAAVKALRHA